MTSPYAGRSFVFDLETNGLLDAVDRVHCAVAIDIDTDEVLDFKPNEIGEFLELYLNAKLLIGHNIIGYDCRVLQKIYGLAIPKPERLLDTMNLARLVFADIKDEDYKAAKKWKTYQAKLIAWQNEQRAAWEQAWGDTPLPADIYDNPPMTAPKEFPGYLAGSHSLEAWGYRLGGTRKGDYAKECKAKGIDPWAAWNPDMHEYMLDDGKLNVELYRHLMSHEPTQQSIELETRVQLLCSQIEINGWPFDVAKAQKLYMELCAERDELAQSLRTLFPPWEVKLPDFIPKRPNKTKGYLAGVPVPRSEIIEFNPSSRAHIADRLIDKYGWKPKEYTDSGSPKVDDEVLQALKYPEAKELARYFLIQKRIGQIGEGKQAWLTAVKNGRIHGRYNTNGAPTGRASHSTPNVAQVPRVGSPYGEECRELFTVLPGFVQLGADQAGLELRCLGSYLASFDGGDYAKIVLEGDVHWENAKALFDLPDDTVRDDSLADHKLYRNVAKTFIYAFLYGAGDEKLGSINPPSDEEVSAWLADPKHKAAIVALRAQLTKRRDGIPPTKKQLRYTYKGSLLRSRFMAKFPALERLITAVKKAAKKGWLKGLDGRKIPVRYDHAALNSLLQSAGAIICKQWIADVDQGLQDAGLKPGWDGDYAVLGWIHDELQVAVRDGLQDQVSEIILNAARHAGDPFPDWRCPTDGDIKLGSNWAECH